MTPHNIKLVETNPIISCGFILTLSGIQCILGMPARTDIAVYYEIISFKKPLISKYITTKILENQSTTYSHRQYVYK